MRVFKISFPCDMEWTEGEDFSRMKGALNVPLMFKLRISSDLRVKKKKKKSCSSRLLAGQTLGTLACKVTLWSSIKE